MEYASSDLRNEHDGILFGLKILEEMIMLIKVNKKVEKEELIEMLDFLRLFADKCHHGKEEGLLFPAMEKVGIKKENGPIGQMLIEHEQGRKYIKEMGIAIERDIADMKRFVKNTESYIELLRNHIDKENTVLFPMADKLLKKEIQDKLLESFEEFEENIMGKGTHEKLHEMLHKFKNKYLKV
jgi:hemerythrin-like domain-containing protein